MGDRLTFWWKALRLGTSQLNAAAARVGTIVLVLGIAGVVLPLVLHLPNWLIAVVLLSLLVMVAAEGSYQVWRDTDQKRKTVAAERDAAQLGVQGKQERVLDLQAAELQQAAADRRRAQASYLSIRLSMGYDPRVSQAQAAAGVRRRDALIAHVHNASDRVARTVWVRWLKASPEGLDPPPLADFPNNPDLLGDLRPGQEAESVQVLPDGADFPPYTAILRFDDWDLVQWDVSPSGWLREVWAYDRRRSTR